MRKILLAVCIVLLLAGLAPAQQFKVERHQLKNGMTVLINEDHSIPNMALYIFYKIGSRNERPGTTGLSHFFEHMMFNGAKKYGPGDFDRVMEAAGGSNNAYTTKDVTVYQDWFPVSALKLIFDLEADRIRDLSFDPKMVNSERGVVASERRSSVENNNFGLLNEQLEATAMIAHPYHWPVIGWMSDIEGWTIDDLKAHFAMGYAPNNAVMVVSGAVDAQQFLALASEYIEPIGRREPPPPVRTKEPPQDAEKRVRLEKFAQVPILMTAYHVPETAHPDFYPLRVLDAILSTGQSSRLYQRLVDRDQLAISVNTGSDFAFDPTLFEFNVQPRENVQPETVEKAMYEEVARLQNELISEQELEKAKNQLLAEFYRQMKTISGRANAIGTYEVFFGDYMKLFNAAEQYAKVTREDVKRVAAQYLKPSNRTVAVLVPVKQPAAAQPAKGGQQ